MLPFLRAGRIVRHHFHTEKLVHQLQRERARLHTVLNGEPRLARFCPMGFGQLTGQARIAVLLTGGGPFDQFQRARGGASPSSRIASSSVSGAHFDEEAEIRLDLRRPAGRRGADDCGSALDVFRDGRIAVEPVEVLSLDAEAADLVEPAFGALDQFINFALKIVVVHRQ